MKSKLSILTTVAVLAWSVSGHSQNSPAASESADNQTPAAVTESAAPAAAAPAATVAADEKPAAVAETPAAPEIAAKAEDASAAPAAVAAPEAVAVTPAAAVVAANDAKPAADAAVTAPVADATASTNAPAADAAASTNAPVADAVAGTNAPAAGQTLSSAIIPLIVMDDVPLTDAIKNLARQAGLNYMLDPKIGFSQAGPNGQAAAQPSVSIRWENITAEQALNALLANYSLQMQEDPKTKIARITVKDPAAPDPLVTRIIQLKYANPSNIVASVQNALVDKRSKVVADIRTSQLVVLATDRELNDIDTLVTRLDTVTKQVLIEAKLLETSMNPTTSKGLDWSGTLQAQHLALGNNLQVNPASAGANTLSQTLPRMLFDTAKGFNPGTAFLDADGVAAVFSFLNKDSEAKVISAPRTVTLDNEPARIEVTRASPIINITPGTVQVSGGSQITYTNLGIILNVTPRISANNYVNLKVTPEVSRIFDTITRSVGPNGVFQADEYDIRKIDTRVMIPSGNTLVLGGLVQDDVRAATTKVPMLGDIPFLGKAFQSNTKSRQKSNLIIFITPTIVQEDDYQKTSTDYLKTPVPTSDSVDGPWSSWDTGKPKDWSKRHAAPVSDPAVSANFDAVPVAAAN